MRYNYTDRALKEQVGEGGGSTSTNYNKIIYVNEDADGKIFNNAENLAWAKEIIKEDKLNAVLNYEERFWWHIKDEYYNNIIFIYQPLRETASNESSGTAIPCKNYLLRFPIIETDNNMLVNHSLLLQSANNRYIYAVEEFKFIENADVIIDMDFSKDTITSDIFKSYNISTYDTNKDFFKLGLYCNVETVQYHFGFIYNEANPYTTNITVYDPDADANVTYTASVNITISAREKQFRVVLTKVTE